ncbi:Translation initiation factor 2B subunit, eIF-2B alpha/beta/delta family [Desulfocicer vacuolatum DSM 3385]|uniref:Translation initiation factor 2B subunit, eIF-2B alpha/beta/delta family n=1 Tax=Desulfocicer vacuolatum DSM 3385 TaxID=1121400 RepID=A0A1W1Z0G8_9BACT|nr:hypothetical protein [Desulfocicer vacuolatum]SMC41886.1 Translation initiation factor 2B subunit, eIF-2B alpha/beta/delta family [Desulfocicer vacuolatum DSM 3385]
MNDKNRQNMYKLLRELGDVQGIARMTVLSLNSFIESIRQLQCTKQELQPLYFELAEALKSSQPKIIPLIHLLEQFEEEMEAVMTPEKSLEEIRETAIKSLEDKIRQFQDNAAKVTENGLKFINNHDVVIVHSASSVVTDILVQAKEKWNKRFEVVILEHNRDRTRQIIQALRDNDIDHIVTPAYDLSHHIDRATKMFVGALTITSDRKIVAPSGTAGTVSLCHLNGIPVHLFANTLHYSHRTSTDQYIYEAEEDTHSANMDFSITSHSHDLVSLDLINHIVTENGETSKDATAG